MPSAVDTIKPEKILRDLRDLWANLANENEESGGVLRACAMTLIVAVESEDAAERGRRVLGAVMHDHPARAIVLRSNPGAELSARVFAECWMPSGSHTQICAEGIELTADAVHFDEAAKLVLPLIVPDLPVVLWFLGSHALTGETRAADPLLKLAQKVIVDSTLAPDAATALSAVRALRAPSRLVADLAWTRLTGWREAIANAFTCNRSAVISSAQIRYAGAASTSLLYFKRWMELAAPSAAIKFEHISGPDGLREVALQGAGDPVTVALASEDSIEIRIAEKTSLSPLPSTSEEALMREELSITGPDSVFDAVLASLKA